MTLNCPVHVHWQLEYRFTVAGGPSGYCLQCGKEYPYCASRAGVSWQCSHFRDHEGQHEHKIDGKVVLVWPNKKPDEKATEA